MLDWRILGLGLCVILAAANCALGQGVIINPSFEMGLTGWHAYSYAEPPSGNPGLPDAGCVGVSCKFDVLYPTSVPDGQNVCGVQSWGTSRNGGVCQDFLWSGGPATVSVTARAYSIKYDGSDFDNGCRVRIGICSGITQDRTQVTEWVECAWGDSWHVRKLTIPGPGTYTLFIESVQPDSSAIMSSLWDDVRVTDLPPVVVTDGPNVIRTDPQHPDTTVTVQWTTNVPSTSRVDYGLATSLGMTTETIQLVTQHSMTLTGLLPSRTYYYRITSTAPDYVPWIGDRWSFDNPIQLIDVATGLTSDGETTVISWKTDVPTTTQVEYGQTTSYGILTPEETNLTTNHQVTLPGLPDDTLFHFRVWGRNPPYTDAVSGDYTFRTLPLIGAQLSNGSFEDGHSGQQHSLYPWVQYASNVAAAGYHPIDGLTGPYAAGGPSFWFSGIQAYDGSYFIGAASNSAYKNGGVFQRVYFPPGQLCSLAARFATYRLGGVAGDTLVRLGIDPTGGVDPESPNIVWWSGYSPTNDSQWHAASVTTKAGAGGVVTVYLDIREQWPLVWHVVAIDGTSFGPPTPTKIGLLKSSQTALSGYFSREIVTQVDPDPVVYQGTAYTRGYIQEDDRSAGIAVLFDLAKGAPPVVGDRVSLLGSLSLRDSEAVLTAETWTIEHGPFELPKPVALSGRNIGGSASNQPALYDTQGLCNVGLRVRVFGRVTWASAPGYPGEDAEAYLDDGSGFVDGSGYGGIRVFLAADQLRSANFGDYITATGVLSVRYVDPDLWPNGNEFYTYRVLTSTSDDWQIIQPAQ